MDQDRALFGIADILEHRDQLLEIMPVDRAPHNKSRAPRTRCRPSPCRGRTRRSFSPPKCSGSRQLAPASSPARRREILARETHGSRRSATDRRQAPDRRRDRHVIVVEDHHQPVAGGLGIVHRLIGHAGRHRPVADHRDGLARLARDLVGNREAKRGRDRGRAVRRPERIIFALAPLGETAEAPARAKRADPVAPAGQYLVRIGIDARRPTPAGQRACRTHNGSPSSARPRQGPSRDDRRSPRPRRSSPAQLVGQLRELLLAQLSDVRGELDRIEQRRFRPV